MIAEAFAAAALICLDPGHGTDPRVGAQREPIGPGSRTLKIKDPGGAPGEAGIALAIARRTRALLEARGLRVAMTRERGGYRGGNVARARFCNARGAALMVRIHADGSADRERPRRPHALPRPPPGLDRRRVRPQLRRRPRRPDASSCARRGLATSGSSAAPT